MKQKLERKYTANPEAYQLYLRGRYQWNKRTSVSLKQAVEFYRQAIAIDPNYALAYSGLAETYVLFSTYFTSLATGSMPQAKAAAQRALQLDESLAEAHTALAEYRSLFEYDWEGSEREFRRAIELNPNYATANQWLGSDNLVLRKRFDEAFASLKRAEELDPLSPVIRLNDKENAFVWLEKQVEERSLLAGSYAVAPELDELRGDLRFKAMLKRMNLPE